MITNYPVVGKTTQLMMTTHLRTTTWLRQHDPLMIIVIALLIGAIGAGVWIEQRQVSVPAAAPLVIQRPIIIFATAQPTVALPTLVPTAPPTAAPLPMPALAIEAAPVVAAPESIELTTMDAPIAPVPTAAARWEGETLVVTGSAIPPIPAKNIGKVDSQGWRCGDTYGDWRDTNPMYAHPECYAE